MKENKIINTVLENIFDIENIELFQKYVLGTKKNGNPRAIYDVVKDYSKPSKKKGKHKSPKTAYSFLIKAKEEKKKNKKKKKKKNKPWHIDN